MQNLLKIVGEIRVESEAKEFDLNQDNKKFFQETTENFVRELKYVEQVNFLDLLETVGYFNSRPIYEHPSRRGKYIRDNFRDDVLKILNHPLPLPPIENEENPKDSRGHEMKIIIPSNIIDIWTRLELFLGPKLSGHTDTLTETSNPIDDFYRRSEVQNEKQLWNDLDKFSTH